jgi:glucose/arabinose dehydrogenase
MRSIRWSNRLARGALILAVAILATGCPSASSSSDEGLDSVTLVRVLDSITFTDPVDLQHAPDGSGRLFIVEQPGTIRVVDGIDASNATTFLDITDRVVSGGERGLLGLAFDPEYGTNGYLYVYYTSSADSGASTISRFEVDGGDPDNADPSSELVILQFAQPASNHNGGQVAFGHDGFLYISSGDGGGSGDPDGNGQNFDTLLGAILRIDVDTAPGDPAYEIPPGNPFASGGGAPEIFATGFRNPWRMSFDSVTGDLWVGDVGQFEYEEINVVEAGGNYGWNTMEGFSCYDADTCDEDGLTRPVHVYDHDQGLAVTGGYVYRGSDVAPLPGRYVFGDYATGDIWSFDADDPASVDLLIESGFRISAFGTDAEDELYVLDYVDGAVYRFTL